MTKDDKKELKSEEEKESKIPDKTNKKEWEVILKEYKKKSD